MAQIIRVNQLASESKDLHRSGKVVLVGGCFDVLHPGHVTFLEKAKQTGDSLIVLLESDEKIKLLKGADRPVHNQADRAQVLSALQSVDYVVLLPFMETDLAYETLVRKIKPDVIAATAGEENIKHLERSAKLVGANLKFVTSRILNH